MAAPRVHAISSASQPKYGPEYTHFDYANPDAPKGGELRLQTGIRFNSFNPFCLKGILPDGSEYLDDTLSVAAKDDPFTQYGLIAKTIEMPKDQSSITFHINPLAHFHDEAPITARDVIFTYNAMIKGLGITLRPFYQHVESVEALDAMTVRFNFKPGAPRSLPFIIGLIKVYPAHYWEKTDLEHTAMAPPIGSGPYRVKSFKPGREIVYERVKNYWAKDHPARRGQFNFNIIRYNYFRDSTVALEAFKAGLYDIRQEGSAKIWATMYTGPAFNSGKIIRKKISNNKPLGIQGFFFNIRQPIFHDQRVRRALMLAFDYEWVNRKLYFGQYPRNTSYFTNSELAARGPARGRELALLEPFRNILPPELYQRVRAIPATPGDGYNRANLSKAAHLLASAGYVLRDGILVHRETRRPLTFRLVTESAVIRRVALSFRNRLRQLGVDMRIILVDPPQFIRRLRDHDYDMVASAYGQRLSPGQEQMFSWHSSSAKMEGGRNLIGVARPEVDALTEALVQAKSREETVAAGRALDRVLLWSDYVIPLGGASFYRLAWWDRFDFPDKNPEYDLALECWWEKTPLTHPTVQKD